MSFHPVLPYQHLTPTPSELSPDNRLIADPWRYGLPASLRDKTNVGTRLNIWSSPGDWEAITITRNDGR